MDAKKHPPKRYENRVMRESVQACGFYLLTQLLLKRTIQSWT